MAAEIQVREQLFRQAHLFGKKRYMYKGKLKLGHVGTILAFLAYLTTLYDAFVLDWCVSLWLCKSSLASWSVCQWWACQGARLPWAYWLSSIEVPLCSPSITVQITALLSTCCTPPPDWCIITPTTLHPFQFHHWSHRHKSWIKVMKRWTHCWYMMYSELPALVEW